MSGRLLEVALKRIGIEYRKYGGLKFNEAAHIKDVLAFMRLVTNPADIVSWQRSLGHIKGVGPKTAKRIADAVISGNKSAVDKFCKKYQLLSDLLRDLDGLRNKNSSPSTALEVLLPLYTPILVAEYPDDYPRRQAGLEQLSQIASNYDTMETFLADLCLDPEPVANDGNEPEEALTLSTVHSAKGLEWNAVILIDLVEDRFPSRKSMQKPAEFEEERRLLYVACTRACDELYMSAPASVSRQNTDFRDPAIPSPFIRELNEELYEQWQEAYSGGMAKKKRFPAETKPKVDSPLSATSESESSPKKKPTSPTKLGFCRHKIFGRGKIVEHISPNKYRVNFPGFGLKVIVEDYIEML